MLHLSQDDVRQIIAYDDVVRAVETGMHWEGQRRAASVQRIDLPVGPARPDSFSVLKDRSTISIWIGGGEESGGSVRLMAGNGGVALYIDETGSVAAIIDFPLVQLYRTGAAAAVATKHLARRDAMRRVAVLGSGPFARATLAAHAACLEIAEVRCFSPSAEHCRRMARDMELELQLDIQAVESAEKAVSWADAVLVCTNVKRENDPPALRGAWLQPGAHVTSNGGANELDSSVYARASRVVVDDLAETKAQVLDIQRAVGEGILRWDEVEQLPDVVTQERPASRGSDQISVARNRGNGVQDLFAVSYLYRKAIAEGVGRDLGTLLLPRPR